uniref:Uncharacterized protein n=1 Tax=Trichogramma kaykai TaxID=54128 RepID=A0ABD2XB04_9HYME
MDDEYVNFKQPIIQHHSLKKKQQIKMRSSKSYVSRSSSSSLILLGQHQQQQQQQQDRINPRCHIASILTLGFPRGGGGARYTLRTIARIDR